MLENNEKFLEDKHNLKLLVTLSEYHKHYIEKNINLDNNTIVRSILHPLEVKSDYTFDYNKFVNNILYNRISIIQNPSHIII
jgi:hypothetical protein